MTTTTLPAPHTSAAELGQTRRDLEALVCDMPGGDPDQMGFEHPWEIRAFAMAVAAHHHLKFDWSAFQTSLIASIQDWETTSTDAAEVPWSYYQHWVTALEAVLANAGQLSLADLEVHTENVLALPPNRNHHEAHTEPIAIDPARPVPA
jgi:nitrile hydratase accessory protein